MDKGNLSAGSNVKAWFESVWADWLRPLGVLIVAAIAYGAYRFELIGERFAGVSLVLLVVVGLTVSGFLPALKMARSSRMRGFLFLFAALALVGSGWPTLRIAFSSAPLATAHLTTAQPKQVLTTNADGPYELIVAGQFKQANASEVEASYTIKAEGNGEDEVSGDLKRATHRYRTSRRGGTTSSLEEHTESVHRLPNVRGGTITVSTDAIDEQLDGGIDVSLRPAGPPPQIFWGLMGLALLIALVLDTRLVIEVNEEDRKTRAPKRDQSNLTIVAGMLFVFSINFPMDATPRSLVRAAVGAFVLSVIAGATSGWVLSAFVRIASRPRRRS